MNKIYNENCITGMKKLPASIVDLIITDPPFAIDFKVKKTNYNRKSENVLDGYCEIKQKDYPQFTVNWLAGAYRILKDTGSIFVFSGWNNLKDVLTALDDIGFCTVNQIIWKYQFGVVTRKKFVTSHYNLIFACKNEKKRKFYSDHLTGSERYKDMEDVWIINREYWRNKIKTPTKLPTEIIQKILTYTSKEDDLIFDPFLGSGQVAKTAKDMNRKYLGFEIVKDYYSFAKNRLNDS